MQEINTKLIIIADFGKEHGDLALSECEDIDGILLDFTTTNLIDVLKNWDNETTNTNAPNNWIVRTPHGIRKGIPLKRNKNFTVGMPHHEQLPIKN